MATIAEVLQKPKGDNVTGLLVRVRSFSKVYDNEGEYGPYRLQRITIEDPSGQAELSWTDPTFAVEKGAWLLVSAYESKRGLAGAKVGEFKGKKNIRATGEAVQLSQPPPTAAAPPASPAQAALDGQAPQAVGPPPGNVWGGSSGKRAPFDPMGRQAAVDTLLGLMKEFVAEMAGLDFSGSTPNLLAEAPEHVLEAAQHMAVSILIGMQKGDIH